MMLMMFICMKLLKIQTTKQGIIPVPTKNEGKGKRILLTPIKRGFN